MGGLFGDRELNVSTSLPFNKMDEETKGTLEHLRRSTPKYLFRAWKSELPPFSGGYKTLNSSEGIVPLAFRVGCGHSSVYDMSKKEFRDMVLKHLNYVQNDFLTELSSWAASLAFVMASFGDQPKDDVCISIIDTHALQSSNEIFFVPGLSFLSPDGVLEKIDHEYLAHGSIRGSAHQAIPLNVFLQAGYKIHNLWMPGRGTKTKQGRPTVITPDQVRTARSVGEQFGYSFTVPVTLALLCLEKRTKSFCADQGRGSELEIVHEGLEGLYISPPWIIDDTVTDKDEVVYVGDWMDINQFLKLMQSIAQCEQIERGGNSAMFIEHAKNENDQGDYCTTGATFTTKSTVKPKGGKGKQVGDWLKRTVRGANKIGKSVLSRRANKARTDELVKALERLRVE